MSSVESAKKAAAFQAVKENFKPDFKYIGIGSGTTIVYVVEAIKSLNVQTSQMLFVPTGYQSRQLILAAELTPLTFDSIPPEVLLDICFDGADEVDDELNCIKGGGACLHQEKLVATHSKKFVCVADYRKLQDRLLTQWKTIPIEVEPLAVNVVRSQLIHDLGSGPPEVRRGQVQKAGPMKTDQGNYIIDAPFPPLLLPSDIQAKGPDFVMGKNGWEVQALSSRIKNIEGVLSVGIFAGENGEQALARGIKMGGQKPAIVYFGMQDGSVVVKRAAGEKAESGTIDA
jgi:ribose 5-phosphate isomerase A